MDEATSNIDVVTELRISELIWDEFKHSTVITIAHRLNTVINSDWVLVLGYGEVIEYDTPQNLLDNTNSAFYSMMSEFQKLD